MSEIHLTPEQEEIADLGEGHFLVVAPPGAGKTEVLAQRVVRLLSSPRGSFQLLAITFTKKAARTMMERVQARLGDEAERATITTFHAFCLDVLRHYGSLIGIPSDVSVYELDEDRAFALTQGLAAEGYVLPDQRLDREAVAQTLERIAAVARGLVPVDAAPEQRTGLATGVTLRVAYRAYREALASNGALDFDHILVSAHELLVTQPQVASHYRQMYRFVLVDEAQDMNALQYAVLRTLCEGHPNVFLVADPAQSIYGFAGASSSYLDAFVRDFSATKLSLKRNFRCAEAVVMAARPFLARTGGLAVTPVESGARGLTCGFTYASEEAEADAAVEWVVGLLRDGLEREWLADREPATVDQRDVACLARTRFLLGALTTALEKHGLEYDLTTGSSGPFDTATYRVLVGAFKVLASPSDLALRHSLAAQVGAEVSGVVAPDETVSDLFARLAQAELPLAEGAPLFRMLAEVTRNGVSVHAMLEMMVDWVATPAADPRLQELLEADRGVLLERWNQYRYRATLTQMTWGGILTYLVDQPRPDRRGIRVLTAHAAKGLEFRCVCILGMNEGSFPDWRNVNDSEDLSGERRLMYVAMTRAARVLRLSRARRRRTRYGTDRVQEQSSFIPETGIRMVDL